MDCKIHPLQSICNNQFFLCIVKLYKEKTHRGYMRVSQQTAVSDHKTQMTSHPLKIAATAGI